MYQEQLSSAKPGLIIVMLDQSKSMEDEYANSTKMEFAAKAVNRVIAEIITACTTGDDIKDRCYIAAIGYGAKVEVIFLEKVSVLARNPDTTNVKRRVSDGAGGLVEVDEILRVFVKSKASGGTPMAEAFREAFRGAEKFISNHSSSFPPIVINITDGEPNDFPTVEIEAKKLANLATSDGNVIVMNAHISTTSGGKFELPSNDLGFSDNKFAKFLFDISTILPQTLADRAKDIGFNIQPNSKGFVYNADAETLIRILNFGSLGALR